MAGKQGAKSVKAVEVPSRFGERFMHEMDGRSVVARELRDRLRFLTADLGGLNTLSYQEQSLCKRAVHLERLIEQKEMALASGRKVDPNVYFSAITTLSSLFSKLGLKRRVKVLSLTDYLQTKGSEPTNGTTNIDSHSLPISSQKGDPS